MLLQLADTWTTTTISKRQLLTFTQLLEESRASNFRSEERRVGKEC